MIILTFGTPTSDSNFKDSKVTFTAKDIRFTTKGHILYAFVMDWPTSKVVTIKTLTAYRKYLGTVKWVWLLGHDGKLKWRHHNGGLEIQLPEE